MNALHSYGSDVRKTSLHRRGFTDLIPDSRKQKVYEQLADITLELYRHLFNKIGMLQSSDLDGSVKGGPIYDSRGRVEASGPFPTPLEFYETRAPLFMDCGKDGAEPGPDGCIPPREIPTACGLLIDPNHLTGPFYLSHPDWAIINLMFDDDFNITAVLYWNSSQILPLESFAQPGQESCSTTVSSTMVRKCGFYDRGETS